MHQSINIPAGNDGFKLVDSFLIGRGNILQRHARNASKEAAHLVFREWDIKTVHFFNLFFGVFIPGKKLRDLIGDLDLRRSIQPEGDVLLHRETGRKESAKKE